MKYKDGGKFLGIAKKQEKNGMGIFIYPDNKWDMGFYENGVLNGIGQIEFKTGDIYLGKFKNGNCMGHGIYYKKIDNKWNFGIFNGNICKDIKKCGNGIKKEKWINLLIERMGNNNINLFENLNQFTENVYFDEKVEEVIENGGNLPGDFLIGQYDFETSNARKNINNFKGFEDDGFLSRENDEEENKMEENLFRELEKKSRNIGNILLDMKSMLSNINSENQKIHHIQVENNFFSRNLMGFK